MIRASVNEKGVGMLELDGNTVQIAENAAVLVKALYVTMKTYNPAQAEIFKQVFQTVEKREDFWTVPAGMSQSKPIRPGPKIPTQ